MSVRDAWTQDRAAFGAWLTFPSAHAAEMVAAMGFDYVCIDWQHGMHGMSDVVSMLQILSRMPPTVLVRVPTNDPMWTGKVLDAGAHGVIVPMVNSREEAELAASGCRFPPDGVRSFGSPRPHQPLGRGPAEQNASVLCFPMIETRQALATADEICTTPGIDGVYIGPSDLGISLGHSPTLDPTERDHVDAIETIRAACERAGIVAGIQCRDGAQAKARADEGFRLVTAVSDAGLLATGAITELGHARA